MACGIKTIYAVKQFLPEKICLLLLNTLVLSHLHYPAILLQGISQNFLTTLEKQLSWGVKACFNRQKHDSSSDLKIKHKILPVRLFLDYKSCFYFWKHQNNLLPAFSGTNIIPTTRIKYHSRTKKIGMQYKNPKWIHEKKFLHKNSTPVEQPTILSGQKEIFLWNN